MKIYIASSWKNAAKVRETAQLLRDAGHEVYDFTDGEKHYSFNLSEIADPKTITQFDLMRMPQSWKAFAADKAGIDWADVVLLLLPAGNSAHAEMAYAIGKGKMAIITGDFKPGDYDVMRLFADVITPDMNEAIEYLNHWDKVFKKER
jgi:nucleoside 2-deoxyribosyltransferase